MIEPERQDLSSLDPRKDAERWDRMVANILQRSAFELRRRRVAAEEVSIFDGLLSWTRPALATAAALTLLAIAALSQAENAGLVDDGAFIWSASTPAPMQEWLANDAPPAVFDLLVLTGEN
jgi:hypothetical protein